MRYFYSSISILVFTVFIFTSCGKEPDNYVEPKFTVLLDTTTPEFNAANAYENIKKQIQFGPRNPNSIGHASTKNFLVSELKKISASVAEQSFEYPIGPGDKLGLTNIIAKFNPAAKDRILLCAHWDTRPWADEDPIPANREKPILGANDGASGVGILLEIARILKDNPVQFGVDIVLFDGEDYGKPGTLTNYCLGSKYYSVKIPRNYSFHIAILLDMVGGRNAIFPKEEYSTQYASEIVEAVWKTAGKVGADKFVSLKGPAIYDDHIPLNFAGIKCIDIIDNDLVGNKTKEKNYWHTLQDTIDKIDISTLDQVGKVVTKFIYSIRFTKANDNL